jgi:hypothetical protein
MAEEKTAPASLADFLAETPIAGIEKDVSISERIPFKFKIKPLSKEQHSRLSKQCTFRGEKGQTDINMGRFEVLCIVESCLVPNFSDAAFLKRLNAISPSEAVTARLLAGEVSALANQILRLSGFNQDINEDVDNAKNL